METSRSELQRVRMCAHAVAHACPPRPASHPHPRRSVFVPIGTPAPACSRTRASSPARPRPHCRLLRWRRFDPCTYMPRLPARWRLLLRLFRFCVVCRPSNDASLGVRVRRAVCVWGGGLAEQGPRRVGVRVRRVCVGGGGLAEQGPRRVGVRVRRVCVCGGGG